MIGDEWIIFISHSNHWFVWTDVEAHWNAIVITPFERHWKWDALQIEETNVVIITSSNQKQNLLVRVSCWCHTWAWRFIHWSHLISILSFLHLLLLLKSINNRQPQHLYIVDGVTIESENKFGVYHLIIFIIICHAIVVFFMFFIKDLQIIRNNTMNITLRLVKIRHFVRIWI